MADQGLQGETVSLIRATGIVGKLSHLDLWTMVRQRTTRENSEIGCQQIKNKQANKKLKIKIITLHYNRKKLCISFSKYQYI